MTPSDQLSMLATFVMKVYAPLWFHIKKAASCTEGSRHVHRIITFSRDLPEDMKAVVDAVIQRKAFFSHPENLLLAMLTDEWQHIRELASRILAARQQGKPNAMRQFVVPRLNFDTSDYVNLTAKN